MAAETWTQKVFRLRNIPQDVSCQSEVAELLSSSLGITSSHIFVYSLAISSDVLENPRRKVATLQLEKIPEYLLGQLEAGQWSIPIPGKTPTEMLILDDHFHGLTVLNEVNPEKHHTDCIAVSGLASHPFGSWQQHGRDKSFMWIRDEIPRLVPGVRAIIYGYNSKLADSKSFQSISDIALGFIASLRTGGWNLDSSKPIIFLGHSLGGLVLKDAIIQIANAIDHSIASILDKLQGAIMFGVPSLGMEQSHLSAIVEGQANEMLVQDLSRHNGTAYLREQAKQFEGISLTRKLQVRWAYETKESPIVTKLKDGSWGRGNKTAVLVNPDSATCNYNQKDPSITVPIDADHSSMVKFCRGDPSLAQVVSLLVEICTLGRPSQMVQLAILDEPTQQALNHSSNVTSMQSTDDRRITEAVTILEELGLLLSSIQRLRATVYSPELDFRLQEIKEPFQDTFQWIFELPPFCSWLQRGTGIFWIRGKPASGKSMLMKLIFTSQKTWELLHDWKRKSLEISAGFFFHNRGSALQKSFQGVLRSLVVQLLDPHISPFREKYLPFWEQFVVLRAELERLEHIKTGMRKDLSEISNKIDDTIANKPSPLTIITAMAKKVVFMNFPDEELQKFEALRLDIEEKIKSQNIKIAKVSHGTIPLAEKCRHYLSDPRTDLFHQILEEFPMEQALDIEHLEKILQVLLQQNIIQMDLNLFFDALDEFDGNLDLISRLLIDLTKISATSTTRVKVCFSSRPWEPLQNHFSKCQGFSLQNHTKDDIAQYASTTLRNLRIDSAGLSQLILDIIERANGVFLWVTLAIRELITMSSDQGLPSLTLIKKKLQELPSDLNEFYKVLIERISRKNRRRTFALLDILTRQKYPPLSPMEIRDAVLLSECGTFQEAEKATMQEALNHASAHEQAERSISIWGGGLVEINGAGRPQMMHQTVLEFTMDLSFKRIVLGDFANIWNENGHSFNSKYCLFRNTQATLCHVMTETPLHDNPYEWIEIGHLAYYAQNSEFTTGQNQLAFINSLPEKSLLAMCPKDPSEQSYTQGKLRQWLRKTQRPKQDQDICTLRFISSFGLSLCLYDWVDRNPGRLKSITQQAVSFPLLSSIICNSASPSFHSTQVDMVKLLLQNGFSIRSDSLFFSRVLERAWELDSNQRDNQLVVPLPEVIELALAALEYGQDPNADCLFPLTMRHTCKPLHIAHPSIAVELIKRDANPNSQDWKGRTPLDWVLETPPEISFLRRPEDCLWRYKMCCILLDAGGQQSQAKQKKWEKALSQFEAQGHDVESLRIKLREQRIPSEILKPIFRFGSR